MGIAEWMSMCYGFMVARVHKATPSLRGKPQLFPVEKVWEEHVFVIVKFQETAKKNKHKNGRKSKRMTFKVQIDFPSDNTL